MEKQNITHQMNINQRMIHNMQVIREVWMIGMGFIISLCYTIPLRACELCEAQQPAMWKGITHGPGPTGQIDLMITWIAIIIVVVTLYFSIKLLIRPKEDQADHIKNIVVEKHHGRPKNHQNISG